ncbi:hypothetical protein DV738_g638, partial [Chaetothyriales sp. CBS 135597]
MLFRATAVRALPRIRRDNPAPYLPKLKLSELQLAVLSKKPSARVRTGPATPPASTPPHPPSAADANEPPINRGPLWSPLYRRKTSAPTALLAAGARTPLIKFLGKRTVPKSVDHAPHAHPASPTHRLPDSFASYRSNAQQHGPLALGIIGARSGAELGPVQPAAGEFFDRSELPRRFRKLAWSEEEIDAVNSGGATSIKPQLSYSLKLSNNNNMSIPSRLILRETTTTGTPSATYVLSSGSASYDSKRTARIDIVSPLEPQPSLSSPASSTSSTLPSPLLIRLLAPLLPTNYPDSVSPDYTPYQIYDSIQAFASTIAGLLAARAVLTSLGESIGRAATIFFAHFFAVRIEAEVKFYRFFADVVNDLAFVLDVLSPSLPAPLLRVPALCLASACRAVCGVCGGSSKAILSAHFATRGNIGELNAKDGSQETVVSLLGMWVGGLVVSKVEGRGATWAWLLGLLAVHLWANWRAVKSVRLRTLNRARAVTVLEKCVRGEAAGVGVEEVGRAEAVWRSRDELTMGGRRWKIRFVSVEDLLQALKWERKERSLGGQDHTLRALLNVFFGEKYVLWLDADRQELIIVLKNGAVPETQLQSWYHAMIVASVASDTSEDGLLRILATTLQTSKRGWKETVDLLTREGWQIQESNLEVLPGPRLQVVRDEEIRQ